ncbi:MAG: trigger factor [Phycisphaerae bacterium]|nr:trigger factor [Phycisphaerae bacterium]
MATKRKKQKAEEEQNTPSESTAVAEAPSPPPEEGELPPTGEEEADIKSALKQSMDVQVRDVGVLRKELTISIPVSLVSEERDKQYSDLIRDAIVPGFRRGRAPRRLVEKRFAQDVGDQVLTKLVTNGFLAATEMKELKVLGDPMIWSRAKGAEADSLADVQTALSRMRLPDDGPLTFRCEVELYPSFTLPELKKIKVKRPNVKITDEDVQKQVDRMRGIRGSWEPVSGGGVQTDDLLIVDATVKVGGQVVKSEENAQLFARPQRIEGVSLEKLGDVLKGAKAGDRRTIEGTIPEDDERTELRGKVATFEFVIHEIKRFVLPALDQALLEAWGYESETELRDAVRAQMEAELSRTIRQGMRNQVARYLVESTKLELPEGISRRNIDRAIVRRMVEARRRGVPQEEIVKHADELRTSAANEAIESLKLYFIMDRLAEQLGVEVSEEEINAQIAAIARQYHRRFDRVRDELAQGDGLSALYMEIRDEKCLERLLEDAEIEETKGPAESLSSVYEST